MCSLLVGVFIFDESVDLPTFIGSAIIIATGLYTFLREHQIAKKTLSFNEKLERG